MMVHVHSFIVSSGLSATIIFVRLRTGTFIFLITIANLSSAGFEDFFVSLLSFFDAFV